MCWLTVRDKAAAAPSNNVIVRVVPYDDRWPVRYETKSAAERQPGSAGTLGTKNLPRAAAFCAGHFRDLDGNKLSVFCMG